MTSKCTAQLLADLGVTRSLSRPQVSDDNPFSEAQFKTVKYHPGFPNRFPDIEAGDISFQINQNAVKVHNGVILIGVKAHGFNMEKRYYAGGIWVYNPITNALYFRNTLSHGGTTNISGTGVVQVGSIQLTPNSDQFFVEDDVETSQTPQGYLVET